MSRERRTVLWTDVCVKLHYLADVYPVAYDAVSGLGVFLCPLQVVGIVVSFQDPDWVRCVEVEFCVVGFGCERRREKPYQHLKQERQLMWSIIIWIHRLKLPSSGCNRIYSLQQQKSRFYHCTTKLNISLQSLEDCR